MGARLRCGARCRFAASETEGPPDVRPAGPFRVLVQFAGCGAPLFAAGVLLLRSGARGAPRGSARAICGGVRLSRDSAHGAPFAEGRFAVCDEGRA